MDKIEVTRLNGVAQTLLVPLVARAHDFSSPRPILRDSYAQHILDKLDLDVTEVALTPNQVTGVALRTSQFDRWTSDFLQVHPATTVLHLACGFDSRMERVNWGTDTRWIDIDLPEVIELRRKIQPGFLPGRNYSLLGIDVLDEDWMQGVSADGPVLVVMEGLLSYLPQDDVHQLLQRLCRNFHRGASLFECVNSATLQSLNRTKPLQPINSMGAEFHWSVDDPKTLEILHPDLKLVESIRLVEAPGVENSTLSYRALMYLLSWIPGVRDSARFLHFQFGDVGRVVNE
ncbi:hypothetical protein FE257_008026 [Aspergillus nanangensis]|uniref:Uncharacterized protein n=1 Tax=Aspergillus nanangensis TaxID=2582783 RepID=A0AAD4GT09_ASPNN|nr:hypothetical protein FE257_008026 [Aspergillus nanangensis]